MKSSEVSIKTSSTAASLSFKGQVTRHTTVKWSIYSVPAVPNTTSVTQRLSLSCLCRVQIMANVLFVIAEHCYGIICQLVCENQTS